MKKIVLFIMAFMLSVATVDGEEVKTAIEKKPTREEYAKPVEASVGRGNYDSKKYTICLTEISTRRSDCSYIIIGLFPNSEAAVYAAHASQEDSVGLTSCCGFDVVELYEVDLICNVFSGILTMVIFPERQYRLVRANYPYWMFIKLKDGRVLLLDTNEGEEIEDVKSSEVNR